MSIVVNVGVQDKPMPIPLSTSQRVWYSHRDSYCHNFTDAWVFVFPEEAMDNSNLSKLYKIRFSGDQLERKNAVWRVICQSYIQKFIKPSDTVIDVACGYGEFINNIIAKRKIAIDTNPDSKKYMNNDVDFRFGAATKLSSIISENVDVFFTSNFLEHLQNKRMLDIFLDQVFTLLVPGGRYIILGPNLRYLPGKYWDFYDHHLGLTHLSLCEALQLKGLSIDICIDRFLPYTTKGSLPTYPWLVYLYTNMPFVWKLLGKQFFIVARKQPK